MKRWYLLHVPVGYSANVPTPLVLDFHGYSQSAQSQSERTWVDRVADEETFIVAYPDGLDDAFESDGKEAGWNAVGTVGSSACISTTSAS